MAGSGQLEYKQRQKANLKEESCERQTRDSVVFYMIFPLSLKLG